MTNAFDAKAGRLSRHRARDRQRILVGLLFIVAAYNKFKGYGGTIAYFRPARHAGRVGDGAACDVVRTGRCRAADRGLSDPHCRVAAGGVRRGGGHDRAHQFRRRQPAQPLPEECRRLPAGAWRFLSVAPALTRWTRAEPDPPKRDQAGIRIVESMAVQASAQAVQASAQTAQCRCISPCSAALRRRRRGRTRRSSPVALREAAGGRPCWSAT